ncbi:carboxylesterase family protein [Embleya sp. NBC_00888]|uniref:carboxylesterase family protein n=1 Tax=Embleya sp. NBC_00888 TaxID=2975960 RepID=UPI00386889DF
MRGQVTGEGRRFPGIPYARPPTGDLRRQTPRPAADWHGVKDCDPVRQLLCAAAWNWSRVMQTSLARPDFVVPRRLIPGLHGTTLHLALDVSIRSTAAAWHLASHHGSVAGTPAPRLPSTRSGPSETTVALRATSAAVTLAPRAAAGKASAPLPVHPSGAFVPGTNSRPTPEPAVDCCSRSRLGMQSATRRRWSTC